MKSSTASTSLSHRQRRWFQPQFSLKALLMFTACVAFAVFLNTRPPTVTSIGKGFYRLTRGFPLTYLDTVTEMHAGKSVRYVGIGRGWTDNPLPAITNWSKLCANAFIFLSAFLFLWFSIPLAAKSIRSVVRSLIESRRSALRAEMIPVTFFGFFAFYFVFWGARVSIVMLYHWLEDYLGQWNLMRQNLASLIEVARPLSAVAAGVVLFVAARAWVLPEKRTTVITLIAFAAMAMVAIFNVVEYRAGRTEQFTWPIRSSFYENEDH